MNTHLVDILARIVEAELPPATERVAVRLLTRAEWTPSGHGQLILPWETYSQLCNRTNRSSARRHLTALVKAGLIHYHASEQLYLTWLPAEPDAEAEPLANSDAHLRPPQRIDAPSADGTADAEREGPRAVAGAHRSQPTRPRAAHGAAPRPVSHTRANGGRGEISSDPSGGSANTTTNHAPETENRLRDLGLRPAAVRIHRDLGADDVRRIIAAWKRDAAASDVGTGALLYRLHHGFTPVDPSAVQPRRAGRYDIPDEYADILIG